MFPTLILCPWPHYKPMKKGILIIVVYVKEFLEVLARFGNLYVSILNFDWIEWISITFWVREFHININTSGEVLELRRHWFMVLWLCDDSNWVLKVIWEWDPCCWEFYLLYLCDFGELYLIIAWGQASLSMWYFDVSCFSMFYSCILSPFALHIG